MEQVINRPKNMAHLRNVLDKIHVFVLGNVKFIVLTSFSINTYVHFLHD